MKSNIFVSSDTQKRFVIGTHNGDFCINEIICCAVLSLAYSNTHCVEIMRTNDKEKLGKANVLVNCFSEWKDIFSYSDITGVWKMYGEDIISMLYNYPQNVVTDVYKEISNVLISPSNDILYRLNNCLVNFLPTWDQKANFDYDKAFEDAIDVAILLLKNIILRICSNYYANQDILYRISCTNMPHEDDFFSNGILEIAHADEPWLTTIIEYNKQAERPVNFVIYPIENGNWAVKCVFTSLYNRNRISFPNEWVGKSGEELVQISGVGEVLSCKNNSYATAKTKQAIYSLCIQATILNM